MYSLIILSIEHMAIIGKFVTIYDFSCCVCDVGDVNILIFFDLLSSFTYELIVFSVD